MIFTVEDLKRKLGFSNIKPQVNTVPKSASMAVPTNTKTRRKRQARHEAYEDADVVVA